MKYTAHDYQEYATNRILEPGQDATGLFLDMGLGKTAITLTAVEELIYNRFEISCALTVAPKRVALDTWAREAEKWDHLRHLKVVKVMGTLKQRIKALEQQADVYVINRENVVWLVEYLTGKGSRRAGRKWFFDMLIIDELSSFKDPGSQRFRALRKVRPLCCKVVGLTGTPAPNGYIDLWPQIYLLDQGERLGHTVTAYRTDYFHAGRMDKDKRIVYDWELDPFAKEMIDEKLLDLCVSMKAEDWLTMPEKIITTTWLSLDATQRQDYKRLEKKKLLRLDPNVLTAGSAAAIMGKLLQYAQGAAYVEEETEDAGFVATGTWEELHDVKLQAMDDVVEAAAGQPILCFYWFKHDLARLQARFPSARTLDTTKDISDWNSGTVPLMLAHPASAGHGLNLQAGGAHVVWFALTWSLELYQQANARLYRQGQEKPVHIQHLCVEGTVEADVLAVLEGKAEGQDGLMAALKARIYNSHKTDAELAEERAAAMLDRTLDRLRDRVDLSKT